MVGSGEQMSELSRSLDAQVRLDANRVLTDKPGGPHTTKDTDCINNRGFTTKGLCMNILVFNGNVQTYLCV